MERERELPEVAPMQVDLQVDVRRQQISILESKRKMRDMLHERSTFQTLY